jgi:hypothetical protein
MVAFAELLLYVAVTVTFRSVAIVVVVAENVAVVAAAATVTDAGTVNAALLSDNVTLAPPLGAALVKVTVHVLEAF